MAPGSPLMGAKRGPTPKKNIEIVKKKGTVDVFGPRPRSKQSVLCVSYKGKSKHEIRKKFYVRSESN